MTIWIIEPRDPFIARDGKPFGAIPGARAASLPFPFPSTTTGGVRTRAGLNANGVFETNHLEDIKKIEVAGPFLVELGDSGEIKQCLFAAPADALLLETNPKADHSARRKRLVPQTVPSDCVTDLDEGLDVLAFAEPETEASKPIQQVRFWYWGHLEKWLTKPEDESLVTLAGLGHNGPQQEVRTHVKLNPETLTAAEGQLFQTQGLEFTRNHKRLALAVCTKAAIKPGLAPLGGERRLVMWRESRSATFPETCPETIKNQIMATGKCRVVLATPGYFEKGFLPTWLCTEREGITPKLTAIACQRYQTVSGWDFETNLAKPSKRLAPAGSVYFLSLETDHQEKIKDWVDATWMQSVSDGAQWQRDGFGVALLGTY